VSDHDQLESLALKRVTEQLFHDKCTFKTEKLSCASISFWEVKAACVYDANPITTDKSRQLRKNVATNATFP
jgi:hypothetical protein